MILFHRHKWTEMERFSTPSLASFKSDRFTGPATMLERMAFGVTTLKLVCECGALKTVEVLGHSLNGGKV